MFKAKAAPNGSNPLTHRSISRELAVSVVVLVLLFEGLLLGMVYRRQADLLHRELEEKADDFALNLRQTLAVPIWDFDDEQVRRIGESFARNNMANSIEIRDAEGETLFAFRQSTVEKQPIVRRAMIVHGRQAIGSVRFSLSLAMVRQDLAWWRSTIFVVMAASLIVIILATGLLLRILMRTPLKILQDGIDRVARGDYDYRFDRVRHAELAGIAARFSEMAAEIQKREDSLQGEVAERRRAEEKIRESEAQTRAILDAVPDMMFQFDRRGRFLDFQGDPENLVDEPRRLIGRRVAEVLSADVSTAFQTHLGEAFHTRKLQLFEYQLQVRDRLMCYECRLKAISEERALAMVRDITSSVTADRERKRLLEKLQRAEKMEAIGTLAGGVAHDLNNVLSGLVSYPEMILLDLPKDSPLRGPMETILKSGERASNIVQDLLTLARRGVSVSQSVQLNGIIRDYLNSPEYETLRGYHPDFEMHVDLAPDLLGITGSAIHLTKTVMNLVSNAAEATGRDGRIALTTVNRYIDTPVQGYDDIKEGDYVVLQVADNGIGISTQDIEHVFEPFYSKKVMGRSGTGLGMAVVWGAVKDHDGYIDMQSTENQGTVVTAYFPASRGHQRQAVELEAAANHMGRGEHILVVDDIEGQRLIATEMLTRLGYEVSWAVNGEQAVEQVRRRRPDLLMLDMIMDPGIDGLETYRRILDIHPGQRAVITSGFSESESVHRAQALGAGSYVKKPYRLETIARAVRKELERNS